MKIKYCILIFLLVAISVAAVLDNIGRRRESAIVFEHLRQHSHDTTQWVIKYETLKSELWHKDVALEFWKKQWEQESRLAIKIRNEFEHYKKLTASWRPPVESLLVYSNTVCITNSNCVVVTNTSAFSLQNSAFHPMHPPKWVTPVVRPLTNTLLYQRQQH